MAVQRIDEMAWYNIGVIRSLGNEEYARELLEARRDFLRLRLRHEPALRKIYIEAAERVADELRNLKPTVGELTRNHLTALEKYLRRESEYIDQALEVLIRNGVEQSFALGGRPLDRYLEDALRTAGANLNFVYLRKGFSDINSAAVEAFWARTRKGLTVSDRIWETANNARNAMRDVIQVGIAQGRDPVKIARDLERYVRDGRKTLSEDYVNMMQRMGRRVPKNLSYEALRLARTEYSKAFFEGVYSRGRVNPAYEGVKYMLSDAHPEPDICDDLASADLYGMGAGVYKKGEEPTHPHPNCICYVVPIVMEREQFLHDIERWRKNPSEVDYLEDWYNDVYRTRFAVA